MEHPIPRRSIYNIYNEMLKRVYAYGCMDIHMCVCVYTLTVPVSVPEADVSDWSHKRIYEKRFHVFLCLGFSLDFLCTGLGRTGQRT